MGSVERIQAVAKRVAAARLYGHDLVVVVAFFNALDEVKTIQGIQAVIWDIEEVEARRTKD